MRWSSSVSDQATLDTAFDAVVSSVIQDMQGEAIDLAVLFLSRHFRTDFARVSDLVHEALPHAVFLGCTAGGVIGGGREVEERPGLALTVARLPNVELTLFRLSPDGLPDPDARPAAWHEVLGVAPDPVPHFVLLGDPFSYPVENLLAGLDYAYPRSAKVGGLASAAQRPGENVLYSGRTQMTSGAVGIAMAGDIQVDTLVAQGCRAIGKPMQITKCQEQLLLELDGQPPLLVLQELVQTLSDQDRSRMSQAIFLGVRTDELDGEDYLIRNVAGMDPERGALVVGERLRAGQTVQFHLRDAESSSEDLLYRLRRLTSHATTKNVRGALLFSCLGRGLFLYGRPDHDTGLFGEHLDDVPLGGFFCNGEIGPVGGSTRLHGYTSSFGLFRPSSSSSSSSL